MEDILTPAEVAKLLNVSDHTLRKWRMKSLGPRWFKLGDAKPSPVRYRRDDLDEYLRDRSSP